MLTCKKTYSDIPFAHRQHTHKGHCSLVHGHNWSITLYFECSEVDTNGFVVDFGNLKYIKAWIEENLDHACLLNDNDEEAQKMLKESGHLFKAYQLPNCSCEGIAQHLYGIFDPMLRSKTDGRVWVTSVEVTEDAKNSAMYSSKHSNE